MPDTDIPSSVDLGRQPKIRSDDGPSTPVYRQTPRSAWLVPPLAVGAVAVLNQFLYDMSFPCNAGRTGRECASELHHLGKELVSVAPRPGSGLLTAHDVAARFAWQSSLVLFVVLAGLATVGGACFIQASLRDSGVGRGRRHFPIAVTAALALLAVVAFGVAYRWPDAYMVRTDVLLPFIQQVFGDTSPEKGLVESAQLIFRASAFTASSFLVLAAGAALVLPAKDHQASDPSWMDAKEHLARQWRRLVHSLYIGAALLVVAIVHQTAFFGWAKALAESVVAAEAEIRIEAAARVDSAQAGADRSWALLQLYEDEHSRAQARRRAAKGPTEQRVAAEQVRAAAGAVAARKAELRGDTLYRNSVRFQAGRDTHAAKLASDRARAVSARVAVLTDAAISRAGGLVYSLLLGVMYLPAALVLLERARALSEQVRDTETERRQWRTDHGLAFSLSTQWSKALAVLSPWLASFPAAQFLLKVLE